MDSTVYDLAQFVVNVLSIIMILIRLWDRLHPRKKIFI